MDHSQRHSPLTEAQVAAYLDRIGAARPARADAAALAVLQRAHLESVPFENLSIHLGEPVVLEPDPLLEKIVGRRRGGFCYELNGAFAALLDALGYRVTLLAAQVFGGERLGPPFDHLALRVDLAEPWLVDVGFGRFARQPLRLDARTAQSDPNGEFELRPSGDRLDALMDGEPQYRLDPRPYRLTDFGPTCWWQCTSPDSHFTRSTTCSLPVGDGRITLSGSRLIRTDGNGRRSETQLAVADLLPAYREHFGIELERVPTVTRRQSDGASAQSDKM